MSRPRQQFIADLWFVFALLTPLFTPLLLIYLTPAHQDTLPAGMCQLMELVLTGPLSLLRAAKNHTIDFTSLCALPTLFVSLHALALRVMSAGHVPWRFAAAMVMLLLTHACLGGAGWLLCDTIPVGLGVLWGSSLMLYVAATTLWVVWRPMRAHGFDVILGLMLMEHLAVPVIGHLLFG